MDIFYEFSETFYCYSNSYMSLKLSLENISSIFYVHNLLSYFSSFHDIVIIYSSRDDISGTSPWSFSQLVVCSSLIDMHHTAVLWMLCLQGVDDLYHLSQYSCSTLPLICLLVCLVLVI